MTLRTGALLVLPGLALVLLAAHLAHAGFLPLTGVALLLIGLLLLRRPWAARVLQIVLGLATIEWALTAYELARLRHDHGQPFVRLLVILGSVTVFTALAALALQHPGVRRYFGHESPGSN